MIPLRRDKIRLLDRLAIDDYKIPSIVLMENAGRSAAQIIQSKLKNLDQKVVILCGKGNNGGDGLVIGRHLSNWGIPTTVLMFADRQQLSDDARTNLTILEKMNVPLHNILNLEKAQNIIENSDIIVDALLGSGVLGTIKESYQSIVEIVNALVDKFVVSVDIPTGLDCDTGEILGKCIKADLTLTFIAPKLGFILGSGPSQCGEVQVLEIGIPVNILTSVQMKELEYLEANNISFI